MSENNIQNDVTEQKEEIPETKSQTPKKSHKKRNIILLIISTIFLVPIFIAGWLGFVPGLSTLLGANKPRDLGVKYTEADFESYKQKTGIEFSDFATAPTNPDNPSKKIVFANPKTVKDLQLTQEELTAAINMSGWLWMPIKNAQVRLGDGTVEVSGNLNVQYIDEFTKFIGGVGYSESDVASAVSWGSKFANNAAIYFKVDANVVNDSLSLDLDKIKIGRFSVPMDIADRVLTTGTSNAIINADNLVATSAQPVSGALLFSGTYPTTIYTKFK